MHPESTSKEMILNLDAIRYQVSPTKKKSTGMLSSTTVQRSPEEIFLMS
jgi:hypothetical protein